MGMFSRQESKAAQSGRPSSDDQLIEMRNKARRRLIGAVVLVLAAIVVIPIFLSEQTVPESEQVVSVIPSIIPPSEEKYRLSESLEQPIFERSAVDGLEDQGLIESDAELAAVVEPPAWIEPEIELKVDPEPVAAPKPEPKPVPKPAEPKPAPKPKPKPESSRSDDGSVAIALLEGRTPPSTSTAESNKAPQGSFVLQIGAYSSRNDADARRTKLVAAGVSNAYVETATVSGKAAYRLRVGPFPSRQAVQAAQTRLRSLGYENSFFSSK